MIKRRICILWVLMLCAIAGWTQILTVQDEDTGEPLELVSISSDAPKAFTSTDNLGQADISDFEGGDLIQLSLLGYLPYSGSYEDMEANAFTVLLKSSFLKMDEIVVSASRWRQSSRDIPAKVISVTPGEVALQNVQTAADLLGVSGKVFIQKSQQGGGSPMIRGFATNRLLYAVDGIRMNTAIFRGGNIQNVISLDPFAMEQTEVFFGPGSVIYGSDAIGGVMSFKTLTPQFSLMDKPLVTGKSVFRTASANNERTGHFHINLGWKKWSLITSISASDYDHLRMGNVGPEDYLKTYFVQRQDSIDVVVDNEDPLVQNPSAYAQMNMMQKVRYRPNDQWDLQYGFHYSETTPYGRYDRHLRVRDGLPRYAEWYYGPQKWMMNNLSISHLYENTFYDEFFIRIAQQSFEESRINRSLHESERSRRIEEVEAYSVNFDLLKRFGKRNTLYYGMEYVFNDVHSKGLEENVETGEMKTGPSRYPNSNWRSLGFYVNDQFKISESFMLQAGVRFNQFGLKADFDSEFYPFPFKTADINSGSVSGSFGMVYRPTETMVISSNLARGFRAPNVDDVGKIFDSEPGAVVVPNPDLKPEIAYNWDINAARIFGNRVKIDLSLYYTLLENALVRRDFNLNGQDIILYDGVLSKVQAIQNAAKARVYGIQTGIEIKFPKGLGLSSDFNIQVGEEELDDGTLSPSRHAAPWFGTTRLTYTTEKLNLQFYSNYQGTRAYDDMPFEEKGKTEIYAADENGNPYAPGWITLNFKAMYQISEHFSLSSGLENITNRRYRPYSSGISAAGRNFILSLTAKF
ncbi:MAG: TonB-dependent receptor [Bacteroidetes bacterium]|nr:MAG: TonB-dependent receptor [Bacteroidota bacterium]